MFALLAARPLEELLRQLIGRPVLHDLIPMLSHLCLQSRRVQPEGDGRLVPLEHRAVLHTIPALLSCQGGRRTAGHLLLLARSRLLVDDHRAFLTVAHSLVECGGFDAPGAAEGGRGGIHDVGAAVVCVDDPLVNVVESEGAVVRAQLLDGGEGLREAFLGEVHGDAFKEEDGALARLVVGGEEDVLHALGVEVTCHVLDILISRGRHRRTLPQSPQFVLLQGLLVDLKRGNLIRLPQGGHPVRAIIVACAKQDPLTSPQAGTLDAFGYYMINQVGAANNGVEDISESVAWERVNRPAYCHHPGVGEDGKQRVYRLDEGVHESETQLSVQGIHAEREGIVRHEGPDKIDGLGVGFLRSPAEKHPLWLERDDGGRQEHRQHKENHDEDLPPQQCHPSLQPHVRTMRSAVERLCHLGSWLLLE
mmetsp:Transcript_17344/g.41697  ORF Transcript_17344/g.41697 Transcript_17344/m.41697 type:complete len:421 (+) Transcript_17344:1266-2528(+)